MGFGAAQLEALETEMNGDRVFPEFAPARASTARMSEPFPGGYYVPPPGETLRQPFRETLGETVGNTGKAKRKPAAITGFEAWRDGQGRPWAGRRRLEPGRAYRDPSEPSPREDGQPEGSVKAHPLDDSDPA